MRTASADQSASGDWSSFTAGGKRNHGQSLVSAMPIRFTDGMTVHGPQRRLIVALRSLPKVAWLAAVG
jgi:hypothetical protein